MILFWNALYSLVKYSVGTMIAVFLCANMYEKKPQYYLKLFLSVGIVIVASVLVAIIIYFSEMQIIENIYYATLFVVGMYFLTTLCYKTKVSGSIFCNCSGAIIYIVIVRIKKIIKYFIYERIFSYFSETDLSWFVYDIIVTVIVWSLVFAAMYMFFRKAFRELKNIHINKSAFVLYIIIFAVTPILNIIEEYLSATDGFYFMLINFAEIGYCIIVFAVQFMLILNTKANMDKFAQSSERIIVEQLLHNSKKQLALLKENMDIINIKCHDMKHQLYAMQQNGLDASLVKEIESSIKIYDSTAKTGNEALDIIITDKALLCNARSIELDCILDGKKLVFMELPDIYTLFGNAIDNAIEYVSKFEDVHKRYIRLKVKGQDGMIIIRCENYYEGQPLSNNDLLKTTKEDKQYHGFGLVSMKRVAEKYGGHLSIIAKGKLFSINIVLYDPTIKPQ